MSALALSIGARKIDGLTGASVAELLVAVAVISGWVNVLQIRGSALTWFNYHLLGHKTTPLNVSSLTLAPFLRYCNQSSK